MQEWNGRPYLEPGTHQSDSDMLNQLGLTYQNRKKEGDTVLAIATFEKCLALKPDMYEPMVNVGVAYSEMGNDQKASEIYLQALLLVPDNPAVLNNLAHLYVKLAKYVDAFELSKRAMVLTPNHHDVKTTYQLTLVGMGNHYYLKKDYVKALEYYFLAPEVQPAPSWVLEKIKNTTCIMGRDRECVKHLEQMLTHPDFVHDSVNINSQIERIENKTRD